MLLKHCSQGAGFNLTLVLEAPNVGTPVSIYTILIRGQVYGRNVYLEKIDMYHEMYV